MTFLGVTLIGSTVGLFAMMSIPELVETGKQIGGLRPEHILGIVALGCVLGMVALYRAQRRDAEKHAEKLYALIEASTEAAKENSEVQRQCVGILVEVKDKVAACDRA